jgi:hypothetical protein
MIKSSAGRMCRTAYPRQCPPKFLRILENEANNPSRRIRKLENAKKTVHDYKWNKKIVLLKEHLSNVVANILDTRAKMMPSNPSMAIRRMVCHKGIKKHMPGQSL